MLQDSRRGRIGGRKGKERVKRDSTFVYRLPLLSVNYTNYTAIPELSELQSELSIFTVISESELSVYRINHKIRVRNREIEKLLHTTNLERPSIGAKYIAREDRNCGQKLISDLLTDLLRSH